MKILWCIAMCIFFVIGCGQAVSVKKSVGNLDQPESGSKEKKVVFRKWDKGSHGDHWSAVFGFQDFKGDLNYAAGKINDIHNTAVLEKNITDEFAKYRKDSGPLSFRQPEINNLPKLRFDPHVVFRQSA